MKSRFPMEGKNTLKTKHFYVVGLSYQKADAGVRGKFSLNDEAKDALLNQAKVQDIAPIFVISTCNRTEIYGFAEHPYQLISLLCQFSNGSVEAFQEVAYIHKGNEAVSHLFKVGTGMDSQILGDFEIIAQVKGAFKHSQSKGLTDAYFERLINSVIQASKRIKNETEISSGATSVSFASVQYILENVPDISSKKILLFGLGKIGKNTCENLVKHTSGHNITLINRTKEKAEKISDKFNVSVKDIEDLQQELADSDVVIVATGAPKPTVTKAIVPNQHQLLILDLSVPKNVEEEVQELENVQLIHLDQLSQITNQTLENRKKHIPHALEIIDEVKEDFFKWSHARKYAPTIHALKAKFEDIKNNEMNYHKKKFQNFDEVQAEMITTNIIQRITAHFASHFKDENSDLEESAEWLGKIFQLEPIKNA